MRLEILSSQITDIGTTAQAMLCYSYLPVIIATRLSSVIVTAFIAACCYHLLMSLYCQNKLHTLFFATVKKQMDNMSIYTIYIINTLFCLGIHKVTRDGNIFCYIADYIRSIIGAYWSKPLFDCLPCMASVWGIYGWLFLQPKIDIITYVIALSGLNYLTAKLAYYGID